MKKIYTLSICLIFAFLSCKNDAKKKEKIEISEPVAAKDTTKESLKIAPISHATMVLTMGEQVLFIDPVGGAKAFKGQENPTHILITDIHADHFDLTTLKEIYDDKAKIIAPKAVAVQLPEALQPNLMVMENGDSEKLNGLLIEAMPMYNLRKEALEFHPKGRGNGYIITWEDEKIYISGDTEDITEMRNLEGITKAFVCMNLPYTMPVESAADAVLDFKPKVVYPYHYRGKNGMSDIKKFKNIVETNNPSIKVETLGWYKKDQIIKEK